MTGIISVKEQRLTVKGAHLIMYKENGAHRISLHARRTLSKGSSAFRRI
jgi:hypothetical protein